MRSNVCKLRGRKAPIMQFANLGTSTRHHAIRAANFLGTIHSFQFTGWGPIASRPNGWRLRQAVQRFLYENAYGVAM